MKHARLLLPVSFLVIGLLLFAACAPAAAPTGAPGEAPAEQAMEAAAAVPPPRCAPPEVEFSDVSGDSVEEGVTIALGEVRGDERDGVPVAAQDITYTDPSGQTFQLTVYSQNRQELENYVTPLALCFEARQVDPPDVELLEQVEALNANNILEEEIANTLNVDPSQLVDMATEYTNSLAVGEMPSLAGYLEWLGLDRNAIFGSALQRVQDEVTTQGLLPEVYALVEERYLAMRDNRRDMLAPFVYPVPSLDKDPTLVVIDLGWLNPPQENADTWVVSFAIHPGMSKGRWHLYEWLFMVASSDSSIWTKIYTRVGDPDPYLFRWNGGYTFIDYDPSAAMGSSKLMKAKVTNKKYWYRSGVYGWDDWNEYDMYGTWWNKSYVEQ